MSQFQSILTLLDRPIAYHRVFAEIGGSVTAGVFLSQAVYWSQRTKDSDGWFWKTQKEWFEETYLKRREQEAARRELRAIGVLEEKKKGTPAKLYFKINLETLANRLFYPGCQDATFLDARMPHPENKNAQNEQPSEANDVQPSLADSYNLLYTETTAETTPENSLKFKDPLNPPKGDRGIANASKSEEGEQEPIAHEPKLPEQNTTSQKNANAVKDQSSAPRRRSPSKATQKIQRAYSGGVPPWRYGYGLNEYHDWFVRYARQKHQELPEGSYYQKSFSPIGLIAFRESKGEFEELQQRCDEAWEIEAKRQAAEAALAAQTIAEAQPEEPREMPLDAIARIMQAQGLTPADVVPEVKSEYRAVFNRLPSDPQEAWDLLSRAQLSIVAAFLEKKYATP